MVKQKIITITTAGVASLALAGVIGMSAVSAATGTTGTSLADKIATAFHLNSADVQKVLDQDRTDHKAEQQAKYEERLTQLVTDDKITSAQKDLIIAKNKEIQAARESNRDSKESLTNDERKAKMEAERTALDTWAKDNGISLQYLMMGGGHGGPGGFGGHGPRNGGGMPPQDQPANDSSTN